MEQPASSFYILIEDHMFEDHTKGVWSVLLEKRPQDEVSRAVMYGKYVTVQEVNGRFIVMVDGRYRLDADRVVDRRKVKDGWIAPDDNL